MPRDEQALTSTEIGEFKPIPGLQNRETWGTAVPKKEEFR
jgi:hypothetical protein